MYNAKIRLHDYLRKKKRTYFLQEDLDLFVTHRGTFYSNF